jgi:hypothetical protein
MMYAETSRFAWDELELDDRTTYVELLGDEARDKGFASVCLTDENGAELAVWNENDGVSFTATPVAP